MIVDAALRHLVERDLDGLCELGVTTTLMRAPQKLQRKRLWKLRRPANAAQVHIDRFDQARRHAVEHRARQHRHLVGRRRQRHFLQALNKRLGVLGYRLFVVGVGLGHRLQHLRESRPTKPRLGRKIRAAPIGFRLGRQEHRQGPAALFTQHVQRVHIDRVDVGPFFAINLDVDKPVVHLRGNLVGFKTLVRHHMAPVAGRVADRQQDRLVLFAGRRQRFLAPRPPMDRVVFMLLQVGAGFVGEAVCHERFSCCGRRP